MPRKNKKKDKAEKRPASKKGLLFALSAVAATAAIVVGVGVYRNSAKPLPKGTITSRYSEKEMHELWESHFLPVFTEGLFVGKYPLPEIQERYDLVSGLVSEKHHQNIRIGLITDYLPESADILGGSYVKDGQPGIDIIVPKLVDLYELEQQRNEPGWEENTKYSVVVTYLHELDHLAWGLNGGTRENPVPLEQLVENERKAWAQTCENTLKPLIEKYHLRLTKSDRTYYNKWVEFGRNVDSPLWKDFICGVYKAAR